MGAYLREFFFFFFFFSSVQGFSLENQHYYYYCKVNDAIDFIYGYQIVNQRREVSYCGRGQRSRNGGR